jgi:DNA repair protein radC
MRLSDRHPNDRPREKLARYGATRLSDLELLMAIVGSGNKQADVGKIAREVIKFCVKKAVMFRMMIYAAWLAWAKRKSR